MTHYIGIDISKRDFHVCFNESETTGIFNNDLSGIRLFIRHLKKKGILPENSLLGLESTGSYHLPVAHLCTQAGYTVHVINPLITRRQRKATVRQVKTDPHDAILIRYCLMNGAGYPFRETSQSLVLKTLVRHRSRFSMWRQRTRLRQEEVSKREGYLRASITDANQEIYDFLDTKIKALDLILKKHQPDTQKLLMSIPGVGPQTAVTFLAEVGDITRFPTACKLVAWVGLDPRVHQSGTSIQGKGYITKRGNKLLRTRLYNASSVAVLRPNIFHTFFQKKRSEGKPYRVALCAVMRKMVHVIHAVWSRGTPFVNEYKSKS
jgi:transposase